MPKFTVKSHEQILAAMLAKVLTRTNLSDVGDSSVIKHLLAASARQDSEQYYQMSLLLQTFSIDTATGEDLDERAKDIQPALVSRLPSAKAVGQVVFTRKGTTGTTLVPTGTTVTTSDGKVFKTTAIGTIAASSPEQVTGHGVGRDSNLVAVVASVGGSVGNVVAGTVTKFSSKPAGVDEVTNLLAFSQGRDLETDDSFRARLKAFVASLSRCTVGSMEAQIVGQQDPASGVTAQYVHVWENPINRGNIRVYVDDGTGTAESIQPTATVLLGTWTWNGTTTVLATNTSQVATGDFIRLNASPTLFFQISVIVPNTSVTILNPGAATIPTGAGGSARATDNVTFGLNGPPPDSAVGGETTLWLNQKPIKDSDPFTLVSSARGNLVRNTDYILNPASGQIDFLTALIASEEIWADYIYHTGLISFVQKLVDGDPTDRENYPGLRAAGILAIVNIPQVLLQNVTATLTVSEGYDQATVRSNVRAAIKDYINTLAISGDVVRAELIRRIMAVDGMYDVVLTTPAANITILDDQLARTTDSNVVIS